MRQSTALSLLARRLKVMAEGGPPPGYLEGVLDSWDVQDVLDDLGVSFVPRTTDWANPETEPLWSIKGTDKWFGEAGKLRRRMLYYASYFASKDKAYSRRLRAELNTSRIRG